jgi:hypothetical protein
MSQAAEEQPVIHHDLRSQDLVAVVQVHFRESPVLVFSSGEWDDIGGFQGMLKSYCFSIRDIACVRRTAMTVFDFAKLGEWEP